MLLAAVIGAVLVWYFLIIAPIKEAQEKIDSAYLKSEQYGSEMLDQASEKLEENGIDVEQVKNTVNSTADTVSELAPIIIKKSSLSEAQQTLFTTLGFGEEVVVTKEVQVCVEVKLGESRLGEIIAGAKPSLSEVATIDSCLKG